MTTLPTELLELLALDPPGHVILDAEARVLGYANANPRSIDEYAPGMTREGLGLEFYRGADTETNMQSALSACKVLIMAGFEVEIHADMMRFFGRHVLFHKELTGVTVAVWRNVVAATPLDDLCDEVEALVKPWGAHIHEGLGPITGPPAIAEAPTLAAGLSDPDLGSAHRRPF
jgi:hypothetical protein